MKGKTWFQIAFLIVGFLTVLEFIFIRGMFTWLIAVAATIVMGAINIGISLKSREWVLSFLFCLATIALSMGYFVIA